MELTAIEAYELTKKNYDERIACVIDNIFSAIEIHAKQGLFGLKFYFATLVQEEIQGIISYLVSLGYYVEVRNQGASIYISWDNQEEKNEIPS